MQEQTWTKLMDHQTSRQFMQSSGHRLPFNYQLLQPCVLTHSIILLRSVQRLLCGLVDMGFCSLQVPVIFVFSTTDGLWGLPSLLCIKYREGSYCGRGVILTTHLHLVLRLRKNVWSLTHNPPIRIHDLNIDNFRIFYLFSALHVDNSPSSNTLPLYIFI